ncbi:hypothetical protein ACFXKW_25425, partial [Streptomyces sp. NPDC059193]
MGGGGGSEVWGGGRAPARAARLVAPLHAAAGRVTAPVYNHNLAEHTDTARAHIAELPFDESEWLRTAKS